MVNDGRVKRSWWVAARLGGLALLGLMPTVGCSGCAGGEGDPCAETARCRDGLACLGDRCARCEASDACKLRGQCVAKDGRCAVPATDDATCATKAGTEGYVPCAHEGLCRAVDGVCTATELGCTESRMCKSAGACSLQGGRCVAATPDDCTSASVCVETGLCTPRDGACAITSSDDCARSKRCLTSGHCSVARGSCVVASDADCKKSALCSAHGQCTAQRGKCIASPP